MSADTVQIKFPADLEDMLVAFANSKEERVGWCLLCNCPIRSIADQIPGTNTHTCEQGIEFEMRHPQQES